MIHNAIYRRKTDVLPASVAFKLYDTYGLNSETIAELAQIESLYFDEIDFEKQLNNRRCQSKIGLDKHSTVITKESLGMKEEVGNGLKEIKTEMECIKEEIRRREEKWWMEKEKLKSRIEALEKKWEGRTDKVKSGSSLRELEERMKMEMKGTRKEKKMFDRSIKVGEIEKRVKENEEIIQAGEREISKRNYIIIKGLRIKEENIKEEVEKWLKRIGVDTKLEKARRISKRIKDVIIAEIGNEEEKRKIMENKEKLRGSRIWIDDYLTPEERSMRWFIRKRMDGKREKR